MTGGPFTRVHNIILSLARPNHNQDIYGQILKYAAFEGRSRGDARTKEPPLTLIHF